MSTPLSDALANSDQRLSSIQAVVISPSIDAETMPSAADSTRADASSVPVASQSAPGGTRDSRRKAGTSSRKGIVHSSHLSTHNTFADSTAVKSRKRKSSDQPHHGDGSTDDNVGESDDGTVTQVASHGSELVETSQNGEFSIGLPLVSDNDEQQPAMGLAIVPPLQVLGDNGAESKQKVGDDDGKSLSEDPLRTIKPTVLHSGSVDSVIASSIVSPDGMEFPPRSPESDMRPLYVVQDEVAEARQECRAVSLGYAGLGSSGPEKVATRGVVGEEESNLQLSRSGRTLQTISAVNGHSINSLPSLRGEVDVNVSPPIGSPLDRRGVCTSSVDRSDSGTQNIPNDRGRQESHCTPFSLPPTPMSLECPHPLVESMDSPIRQASTNSGTHVGSTSPPISAIEDKSTSDKSGASTHIGYQPMGLIERIHNTARLKESDSGSRRNSEDAKSHISVSIQNGGMSSQNSDCLTFAPYQSSPTGRRQLSEMADRSDGFNILFDHDVSNTSDAGQAAIRESILARDLALTPSSDEEGVAPVFPLSSICLPSSPSPRAPSHSSRSSTVTAALRPPTNVPQSQSYFLQRLRLKEISPLSPIKSPPGMQPVSRMSAGKRRSGSEEEGMGGKRQSRFSRPRPRSHLRISTTSESSTNDGEDGLDIDEGCGVKMEAELVLANSDHITSVIEAKDRRNMPSTSGLSSTTSVSAVSHVTHSVLVPAAAQLDPTFAEMEPNTSAKLSSPATSPNLSIVDDSVANLPIMPAEAAVASETLGSMSTGVTPAAIKRQTVSDDDDDELDIGASLRIVEEYSAAEEDAEGLLNTIQSEGPCRVKLEPSDDSSLISGNDDNDRLLREDANILGFHPVGWPDSGYGSPTKATRIAKTESTSSCKNSPGRKGSPKTGQISATTKGIRRVASWRRPSSQTAPSSSLTPSYICCPRITDSAVVNRNFVRSAKSHLGNMLKLSAFALAPVTVYQTFKGSETKLSTEVLVHAITECLLDHAVDMLKPLYDPSVTHKPVLIPHVGITDRKVWELIEYLILEPDWQSLPESLIEHLHQVIVSQTGATGFNQQQEASLCRFFAFLCENLGKDSSIILSLLHNLLLMNRKEIVHLLVTLAGVCPALFKTFLRSDDGASSSPFLRDVVRSMIVQRKLGIRRKISQAFAALCHWDCPDAPPCFRKHFQRMLTELRFRQDLLDVSRYELIVADGSLPVIASVKLLMLYGDLDFVLDFVVLDQLLPAVNAWLHGMRSSSGTGPYSQHHPVLLQLLVYGILAVWSALPKGNQTTDLKLQMLQGHAEKMLTECEAILVSGSNDALGGDDALSVRCMIILSVLDLAALFPGRIASFLEANVDPSALPACVSGCMRMLNGMVKNKSDGKK